MWEIVKMFHGVEGASNFCVSYFKPRTEQCNWWNTLGDPQSQRTSQMLLKGNVCIELRRVNSSYVGKSD